VSADFQIRIKVGDRYKEVFKHTATDTVMENLFPTQIFKWHMRSRWYTPDTRIVTIDMYAFLFLILVINQLNAQNLVL